MLSQAILFPGVAAGVLSAVIMGAAIALHVVFKPFQNGPQTITVYASVETVADANNDAEAAAADQDNCCGGPRQLQTFFRQTVSIGKGGGRLRFSNDEGGRHAVVLSRADKLELICMSVLLLTYLVGLLSSAIEPKDGEAAAVAIIILVVLMLLSPVCAAVVLAHGATAEEEAAAAEKSDAQVVPPRRGKKGKGDQGQGYGGGGGGTSFFMGDDGANPTYDDDDDGLPMVMIASKRDLRFE